VIRKRPIIKNKLGLQFSCDGQISELQVQYKQIDSRINELKKAQEMVQKIIKPQQKEEQQKDIKKEREER